VDLAVRVSGGVGARGVGARGAQVGDGHGHHGRLLLLDVDVLDRALLDERAPGERAGRERGDVALAHEERLRAHDEERAAAAALVGREPQLAQAHVVDDADLGVHVRLPPHRAQRGDELAGVAVDADPRAVDEDLGQARGGAGREVLEALGAPLVEELEDGRGGAADGDVRHEREVLDEAAGLPLGRLRRADHAPLRVVELARLRELALAPDRRVDAPQVRERRGVGEPVEDLGDARAHLARAGDAPVAGGERVAQPARDRVLVDRGGDVDLAAAVDRALRGLAHVLSQLPEQLPEEAREERPAEVEPLVRVVVAVVFLAPTERDEEQPVDRVPEEVRLPRLGARRAAHVREELLLEELARVRDALLARRADRGAALADVVERDLLALDREGLFDRGAQRLEHLRVGKVVDDVLEDVAVGDKAERAEDDQNRDVGAHVGQRRADRLPRAARRARAAQHLDRHRRHRAVAALGRRAHLRLERVLARLALAEDVHVVVRHPLLRDEHLLGAVDHEVAALVIGALAELREVRVRALREVAVVGAEHDRHLAEEDLVVAGDLDVRLGGGGAAVGVGVGGAAAVGVHVVAGRAARDHVPLDVDVERRGVGQVAQARLLREEDDRLAVGLDEGRLGEVDLAEADLRLGGRRALVRLGARVVLVLRRDRDDAALVDDVLERGVDEVVEGVELLADEALLLEVGGDDGPVARRGRRGGRVVGERVIRARRARSGAAAAAAAGRRARMSTHQASFSSISSSRSGPSAASTASPSQRLASAAFSVVAIFERAKVGPRAAGAGTAGAGARGRSGPSPCEVVGECRAKFDNAPCAGR
jgi:hypothetical protein